VDKSAYGGPLLTACRGRHSRTPDNDPCLMHAGAGIRGQAPDNDPPHRWRVNILGQAGQVLGLENGAGRGRIVK